MASAAGSGKLVGYWGSPCPNGPSTHLCALYVSSSGLQDFNVISGPPIPPDTETKICPDCVRVGTATDG